MTITPQGRTRLDELGDALLAATAENLAQEPALRESGPGIPSRKRSRPRRRTLAVALAATAIALPGAAFAASSLISEEEVAKGLPNAIAALAGSEPACETVRAGLEYDCVLAHPPTEGDIVAPGAWKGVLEPTVDDTRHVSGGCRSLDDDGTEWRCYVGKEAVRRHVIAAGYLGEYLPNPVRG